MRFPPSLLPFYHFSAVIAESQIYHDCIVRELGPCHPQWTHSMSERFPYIIHIWRYSFGHVCTEVWVKSFCDGVWLSVSGFLSTWAGIFIENTLFLTHFPLNPFPLWLRNTSWHSDSHPCNSSPWLRHSWPRGADQLRLRAECSVIHPWHLPGKTGCFGRAQFHSS